MTEYNGNHLSQGFHHSPHWPIQERQFKLPMGHGNRTPTQTTKLQNTWLIIQHPLAIRNSVGSHCIANIWPQSTKQKRRLTALIAPPYIESTTAIQNTDSGRIHRIHNRYPKHGLRTEVHVNPWEPDQGRGMPPQNIPLQATGPTQSPDRADHKP
jgi:hypothetical protein